MLYASIEHITSNDTQHSEVVSDTRERPAYRIRQKSVTLLQLREIYSMNKYSYEYVVKKLSMLTFNTKIIKPPMAVLLLLTVSKVLRRYSQTNCHLWGCSQMLECHWGDLDQKVQDYQ